MTASGILRIACLAALLTLFTQHKSTAQSYLLSSLPVEKELSSRQITCFFQDSKGFMWIGTEDGLNLYNANSVKIFKHDVKNKNTLLNNYIQNICEDKGGNIWIGTAQGIDRFTPSTNSFQHFTADDEGKSFGFKAKVFSDRKDNIWIGCDGLFKLDTATQQFRKIVNPYSNLPFSPKLANSISGFYQDTKGNYWVSTSDGLFLYDDLSKTFSRFDTPPADDNYKRFGILFSAVYENKNGELWVGSWGYGIFKILLKEKKLLLLGERSVSLTYTSQQLNDHDFLWCSYNGLVSFDKENKIRSHLTHQADDPFSLRNNTISTLFTDKQGQLWIGYEKQGVQILSPGNQLIKTYTISSENDKNRISSVGSIAIKNNIVYVGGWYSDALCKLNSEFKPVQWWPFLPADKNNSSSNVADLYFDQKDNLWIATFNGLVQMNERTGEIKNYRDENPQSRNRFLKILPEGDSVFWLAGYYNGLTRFSLATHRFQLYSNTQSIFWKIVFDKTGNIWCANNEGLLEKFDRQSKTFSSFRFDSLTERSMYLDLAYDSSENILWVAGTSGLLKVNLANLKAQLFTEKNGLPTTRVNLLTWDKYHRLWIGTDRGLSLFTPQKNTFRNIYINNGLSNEKLDQCLVAGPDGKLYIGSDNSIMVMDINAVMEKDEIPPVYITSITENNNLLQKNERSVIHLPYNQNNLSFEFAITDYINSEDNQLLYKLEGWDQDFINTKKGGVNYNKLPPGTYTFRVKGINHNGIKNEAGDTVTIIIHHPFWETWWFISLISVALLTVFILVVRYISQRNLKEKLLRLEKQQAVEKERNRISRDMHDDLGSGLTKIAILSEVVKKQIHQPEKAKQQLDNISESSRELVDSLQDIIWVLNPKNDTLESLATYIREHALKFFEPFGIHLQFSYPEKFPELKLSEETRRNIFLVTKESFNNIAKHAWCNEVKVSIEEESHKIHLTISDDGKGFELKQQKHFGNGLINMQSRVEQIEGKYHIISEPGKGTKTEIEIPV